MIYVIKTQNNDVILFDSILSFSESYQGSVTSSPVEDGTKISDNIITENVKLKLQGVVTDYNFWNPIKDAGNQKAKGYDYPRAYGNMIIDTQGQPETTDNVAIPQDYSGTDDEGIISVKASMDIVKQKLISIQRNKEFVTILGYNTDGKDSVVDKFDNCVFTDISFDVSPDSGYAIYPNISIEQVNVVRVRVTQASGDVITERKVANQAAGDAGKGNQKPTNGKDEKPKAETKEELHKPLMNIVDIKQKARDLKVQTTIERKINTFGLIGQ